MVPAQHGYSRNFRNGTDVSHSAYEIFYDFHSNIKIWKQLSNSKLIKFNKWNACSCHRRPSSTSCLFNFPNPRRLMITFVSNNSIRLTIGKQWVYGANQLHCGCTCITAVITAWIYNSYQDNCVCWQSIDVSGNFWRGGVISKSVEVYRWYVCAVDCYTEEVVTTTSIITRLSINHRKTLDTILIIQN